MVTAIMEPTIHTILNRQVHLHVKLWEDLLSDLNRRKIFAFDSYSFLCPQTLVLFYKGNLQKQNG